MICINCEHGNAPESSFCDQCAAPLIVKRLTVSAFFKDFFERYLSFDNKFLHTFKALIFTPEAVVNGYKNGLRIRYVNPITFLVIAVTLSSIQVYLLKNGYIIFALDAPDAENPFDMKAFNDWIFDHQNLVMFLTIPLLAFVSKIVFLQRTDYNFAEHNLIYFYTYSVVTIFLLVCIMPIFLIVDSDFMYYSLVSFLFLFAYHTYALKRIFALSVKQIVHKTLLFIPVIVLLYLILIIIGVIIFAAYMFATGQINIPK
jgi:hypothetical protein